MSVLETGKLGVGEVCEGEDRQDVFQRFFKKGGRGGGRKGRSRWG